MPNDTVEWMEKPFSRSTSNVEKVERLLKRVTSDDALCIVINADPDAIASALALRRIFWRRLRSATIAHINPIRRADNLALIRQMGVNLKPFRKVDRSSTTRWAMVDSQPHHSSDFEGIDFDILIDHHPIGGSARARFLDIRPDYGANSTIMTEYLRAAGIRPSARLATALFLGVKNDTQNFLRTNISNDINAFRYLHQFANLNVVKKIESSEMTRRTLESFRKGMNNLRIFRDVAYVDMGRVANADTLVIIADFFLRLAEVTWSFVSGRVGRKLVIIIRNAGFRRDAGRAAQELFGDWGSAGGRKQAARAEIPLKNLKDEPGGEGSCEKFVIARIRNHWHRQ